jgi:hypothetical protein
MQIETQISVEERLCLLDRTTFANLKKRVCRLTGFSIQAVSKMLKKHSFYSLPLHYRQALKKATSLTNEEWRNDSLYLSYSITENRYSLNAKPQSEVGEGTSQNQEVA